MGEATIFDIPWEDVLFTKVLPRVTLLDCCNLRKASPLFEGIVDGYFMTIKRILRWEARALRPADLELLAAKTRRLEKIDIQTKELSTKCAETFLKNNVTLTHVNFSYTSLNDSCLFSLINCVELRQLILKGCDWVTNECLLTLRFHLTKLEYLNLTCCPQLDILTMGHQLSNGPRMKYFEISPGENIFTYGYVWKDGSGFLYSRVALSQFDGRRQILQPRMSVEGWMAEM